MLFVELYGDAVIPTLVRHNLEIQPITDLCADLYSSCMQKPERLDALRMLRFAEVREPCGESINCHGSRRLVGGAASLTRTRLYLA